MKRPLPLLVQAIEAVFGIVKRMPDAQKDCLIALVGSPATTNELTERLNQFSGNTCGRLKRKGFVAYKDGKWSLTETGEQIVIFIRPGRRRAAPVNGELRGHEEG